MNIYAEVEVNIDLLERVGKYVDFVYIPELDRKVRLIFKIMPEHPIYELAAPLFNYKTNEDTKSLIQIAQMVD